MAQGLEDLKNYQKEIMQNLEDVEELKKDTWENYLDEIDKAQDAFEEQIKIYEQVDKVLEHDMNLIKTLYPQNLKAQEQFFNKRQANYLNEIDMYRQEADMWKSKMDSVYDPSKSMAEQSEDWKKFRDNWMDSVDGLNDAVENSVENLLDKYNNAVQYIIQDAKDKLAGGGRGAWQSAADEWDRAQWNDDRYLDDLTRATDIARFQADVNSAMNDLAPKQQKDMLKFMNSEISNLESITNLRQIDVDIANKKFEIMKAQMALEDAQQAKTQMRLRRDSQGNYTYQYVADEDASQNKAQELRDLIEELRQMEDEDLNDTTDEAYSKIEEFFDKAQELTETYYDDQELLQEKLAELQEAYLGEDGILTKLGVDHQAMQSELLNTTGTEYATLLKTLGEQTRNFLGLGDSPADKSVWNSINALMGDDGKVPTLLDSFVNNVFVGNFNKNLTDEARKTLLEDQGISSMWDTTVGNITEDVNNLKDTVIKPAIEELKVKNGEYQDSLQEVEDKGKLNF